MNKKSIQIAGFVCSILGILIAFKIIFYFFNPSEIWTIIILATFVLLAYGVQLNVWSDEMHEEKIFGLYTECKIEVYEQMTIFGIIPISSRKRRYYERKIKCDLINKTANFALDIGMNAALRFLPFGGLLQGIKFLGR